MLYDRLQFDLVASPRRVSTFNFRTKPGGSNRLEFLNNSAFLFHIRDEMFYIAIKLRPKITFLRYFTFFHKVRSATYLRVIIIHSWQKIEMHNNCKII